MRGRRCAIALVCRRSCAAPARADVADYLGKPVAVGPRSRPKAARITDPARLDLLETGVGRPLRMRDVRRIVTHLFSLGRFENVVVRAEHGGRRVCRSVYELCRCTRSQQMRFDGDWPARPA